jgi:hypothetical protein
MGFDQVWDQVAERQVLALVLSGHPGIGEKFARLPHDVFVHQVHRDVATALRTRLARGVPVADPQGVAAEAAALTGTDHRAQLVYRFVVDASLSAPPLDGFGYYADVLIQKRHLRNLLQHGQRIVQLAESAASGADLADITAHIRSTLDEMGSDALAAPEPPLSLQELLDEPAEPHNWLIPNLLERSDRLVLTGFEGTGKSMLLAQMALATAAGVHPFTAEPISRAGYRVLIIDCENSRNQIRRRYRAMVGPVNAIREDYCLDPVDWSTQLRFVHRPEGVDLTEAGEFARIEQAIAATAPDLVVAGPLYRMHRHDVGEEPAARALVDALDRLRVKHGFTLICEAHSGHAGEHAGKRKLRPVGSSLFLRWPEFGYGIRAFGDAVGEEHPSIVEVVAWRGSREERHWPLLLKHGSKLPWMPGNTSYNRPNMQGVR